MMARRFLLQAKVFSPMGRHTASFSTARVFPAFSSYGSDAAFQVTPIPPQYTSAPNGSYLKMKRSGSLMLSWAKATSNGYNWANKTFFSLNPLEIGLVLELLDGKFNEISIPHSPSMNADENDPGKKILDVIRTHGTNDHLLTIFKFTGGIQVAVSLNTGEARALRELLVYSIPRLYGYHSVLEGPLNVEGGSSSNSNNNSNYYNRTTGSGGGGVGEASRRGGNNNAAADWPF